VFLYYCGRSPSRPSFYVTTDQTNERLTHNDNRGWQHNSTFHQRARAADPARPKERERRGLVVWRQAKTIFRTIPTNPTAHHIHTSSTPPTRPKHGQQRTERRDHSGGGIVDIIVDIIVDQHGGWTHSLPPTHGRSRHTSSDDHRAPAAAVARSAMAPASRVGERTRRSTTPPSRPATAHANPTSRGHTFACHQMIFGRNE
jgi:hypothetical protein